MAEQTWKDHLANIIRAIANLGCHNIPAFPGIIVIGKDGNVIFISQESERILKIRHQETIGKSYKIPEWRFTNIDGNALKKGQHPFEKVISSKTSAFYLDYLYKRPDNKEIAVSVNATPVKEDGQIHGVILAIRDITKTKEVDKALLESNARYRALFDDCPIALIDIDFYEIKKSLEDLARSGVVDFSKYFNKYPTAVRKLSNKLKVEDVNNEAIKLYKAKNKKDLIDNFSSILNQQSLSAFKQGLVNITKGINIQESEIEALTLAKDTVYVSSKAFMPAINDSSTEAIIAISNISEQKQAEYLSNALNNINITINSTLKFEEIIRLALNESVKALGAEKAAIDLREGSFWVPTALYGFPKALLKEKFSDNDAPFMALPAEQKKALIINDVNQEKSIDTKLLKKLSIKSLLSVPLIVRNEVIGVLSFYYVSKPIGFTDLQVDFCNKLATSISLAVENSRLYAAQRKITNTLQDALLKIPEKLPGIDFCALYRSASELSKIGGDFYDLFILGNNKIGITMGDVSGKGLEASSLATLVRSTIKAYSFLNIEPSRIIKMANDIVIRSSAPSAFVTVFFGLLDIETGIFNYCNAGHPPPIVQSNTKYSFLKASSPAIGVFSNQKYVDENIALKKKDVLFLYTDGVTEAKRNNNFFGENRLITALKQQRSLGVKRRQNFVFNDVLSFSGGVLNDDVALLFIALR